MPGNNNRYTQYRQGFDNRNAQHRHGANNRSDQLRHGRRGGRGGRGKKKRLPALTIVLLICIVGFIVFIPVYILANRASGQEETGNSPVSGTETVNGTEAPSYTEETPGRDETPDATTGIEPVDDGSEPDIAEEQSIITVTKELPDIKTGHLLLVNPDHSYDIPADIDLARIVDIGPSVRVQLDGFQLLRPVIEPLNDMMEAFISESGNKTVAVIAAFRTHATQQTMVERHGSAAAKPGHSEHHTGLAFDFGIFTDGNRSRFMGTGSTAWFRENSYKFGFIMRFPEDKTHITQTEYEPWHFRYTGLPHSYIMFQNNWVFEEYIENIRQYTFENPLSVEFEGISYEIYFTSDLSVPVPYGMQYDISGNNVDGFIITITGS